MADVGKPSFFSAEVINGTLLTSFINSTNDFSKQLTTVLLMSSIDEIKKILSDVIVYIRANFRNIINPYPLLFFLAELPIIRTILRYFSRRDNIDTKQITYHPSPKVTQIEMVYSDQFLGGIIQYIGTGEGRIVYNQDYSIDPKNRNDLEYTKLLKYFEVRYKSMVVTCSSPISAKFGPSGCFLMGSGNGKIDATKVRSIMDLVPFGGPTYNFLKENVDYYMSCINLYGTGNSYISVYMNGTLQLSRGKLPSYSAHDVVSELASKYPNLNISQSCFEFEMLAGIIKIIYPSYFRKTLVLQDFRYYIERIFPQGNNINGINRYIIEKNPESRHFYGSQQIDPIISPIFHNGDLTGSSSSSPSSGSSGSSLLLNVSGHDDELFREFINTVMSSNNVMSTKIKIYDVKVQHNETILETPNPAYEKIEAQIALEQQNPDSKEFVNELKRRLLDTSRTIPTKSVTHQVESVFVTEKCKDFRTLYLREREKKQLCGLIDTYKTNKDRLIQLGLPDKLGILLEGLPGTGKTSTIWAIATALKKNIYYVNLNTVMTNQQLTDVFRFVDNEANGGIIVFEDIDSMTDVVLQRTRDTVNGALTLGHLLNLLQGTLTKDGTMFIVTTNHLEHLDAALCRDGRFDLIIKMQLADRFQCAEIFNTFFSRKLDNSLLELLPEDSFTPAKFIFYLARHMWSGLTDEELIRGYLNYLRS